MIDRRAAVRLGFGASALALLGPAAGRAEPSVKPLLPFLVDLPGWQGQKPTGFAFDSGGGAVVTATREYRRGADQIHLAIVVGPTAAGALAPIAAGMKLETAEGHMLTGDIAGFKAMRTYQISDKSGAILVALGDRAMLSFGYRGLAEDEALSLLEKLDLAGVRAAATAK